MKCPVCLRLAIALNMKKTQNYPFHLVTHTYTSGDCSHSPNEFSALTEFSQEDAPQGLYVRIAKY